MNLTSIPYSQYENGLPQSGHYILGQETADSIYVYQAYNHRIADYAIKHQKFGGSAYSFSRMTWIKPNFLWMMFRSGWASKVNQERILALKISKKGFLELLEEGVFSSYQAAVYGDHENWKQALAQSEVRIQWDPDHHPSGEKLVRKAVQIGLKGKMLEKFNQEFMEEILDLTPFVIQQREAMQAGSDSFLVIKESVIEVPLSLKTKYSIPR